MKAFIEGEHIIAEIDGEIYTTHVSNPVIDVDKIESSATFDVGVYMKEDEE